MLLQIEANYVPKKLNKIKTPLWDKDGNITRDISFELQFGFKDTLDIPEYVESDGLESYNLPKQVPIKF